MGASESGETRHGEPQGGGAAQVLLYLGGGLLVAWFLIWLTGRLIRRKQTPVREAQAEPSVAVEADPELDEIDRLAASGAWSEAIHLLLLLAIRRLSISRHEDIRPSSTGRELVRLLPRSDPERRHFSMLVASVERALFAGQPQRQEGFLNCREVFVSLQQSLQS